MPTQTVRKALVAATIAGALATSGTMAHERGKYWCQAGVGVTPFASAPLTRYLLRRPDEWARSLSQFDMQGRQRSTDQTNLWQFLRFAGNEARSWTRAQVVAWWDRVEELDAQLRGLNVRLPLVFMSTTTGLEELGANAYTRRRMAVFAENVADLAIDDPDAAFKLLAHEYFHIASRFDPRMRDELYALIGFFRVRNAEYPDELIDSKLTNPDAFRYEHAITVSTSSGELVPVVPVTQSAVPIEEFIALPDPFAGVTIDLVAIDAKTGRAVRDENGDVVLYHFGNTDYIPQVLRNTTFIIAPDEILADNFSLLMLWRKNGELPSDNNGFPINDQGLLESMQAVLAADCDAGSSPKH